MNLRREDPHSNCLRVRVLARIDARQETQAFALETKSGFRYIPFSFRPCLFLDPPAGSSAFEYVNYSKEFAWPALFKRYQVSWI